MSAFCSLMYYQLSYEHLSTPVINKKLFLSYKPLNLGSALVQLSLAVFPNL